MGDITYPRVNGVVFIHGAFQRGDAIYLPRKRAEKILRFKGWVFKRIVFEKRSDEDRKALRAVFDDTIREAYLKQLAKERREDLIKAGLSDTMIATMAAKGTPPSGYEVHHILPLEDGGTNAFENLLLTRADSEHTALSAFQKAFTKGLAAGDLVEVDFPVPMPSKNFAIFPPASQLRPRELRLWRKR